MTRATRIWICHGPPMAFMEIAYQMRWCFKCRERTRHHWACWDDLDPSYYGPHWDEVCEKCGGAHSHFPQ